MCVSFSNGANLELLSFAPDAIETFFSRLSYRLDTSDEFHTYRIVFRGADFRVFVDGVLRIDGTGKFTQSTTDNQLWFGSGGGVSTGESYWEYVKFSGQSHLVLLSDLVLELRYGP